MAYTELNVEHCYWDIIDILTIANL